MTFTAKPCTRCGARRSEPADAGDPRTACTLREADAVARAAGVCVVGGRGESWLVRGQDGVEVTVPSGVCPRCLGEALRRHIGECV